MKDIKELALKVAKEAGFSIPLIERFPDRLIDFATRLIAAYLKEQEPVAWIYCPECGSEEIHYEEGGHKQCANCHQEWFSDIDYSDVVQSNLSKLFTAPPEPAPQKEPVAWRTHHDEPMLFPTINEAWQYCEDDEGPEPLFAAPVKDSLTTEPAPPMPLGVSEGTATSACAAQLQDQVENLAALVNRLCRQVNKFDSGNAVAVAASKYIFDNDLIKTSLRKDDEGIRKIIDMVNSHG